MEELFGWKEREGPLNLRGIHGTQWKQCRPYVIHGILCLLRIGHSNAVETVTSGSGLISWKTRLKCCKPFNVIISLPRLGKLCKVASREEVGCPAHLHEVSVAGDFFLLWYFCVIFCLAAPLSRGNDTLTPALRAFLAMTNKRSNESTYAHTMSASHLGCIVLVSGKVGAA